MKYNDGLGLEREADDPGRHAAGALVSFGNQRDLETRRRFESDAAQVRGQTREIDGSYPCRGR